MDFFWSRNAYVNYGKSEVSRMLSYGEGKRFARKINYSHRVVRLKHK